MELRKITPPRLPPEGQKQSDRKKYKHQHLRPKVGDPHPGSEIDVPADFTGIMIQHFAILDQQVHGIISPGPVTHQKNRDFEGFPLPTVKGETHQALKVFSHKPRRQVQHHLDILVRGRVVAQ